MDSLLLAVAEPLLIALLGLGMLLVLIRRRTSTQSASGPVSVAALARRGKAGRTMGLLFLLGIAAYLALKLIPQTLEYLELRRNLSRGKQVAQFAQWDDLALRCASGEPLGMQLHRLFSRHEIYVLRVVWNVLPPRYEILATGQARITEGSPERFMELRAEVGLSGNARLTGATLLDDPDALASARPLLANACRRSLRVEP